MRSFVSTFVAICAVVVLSGCGAGKATTETTDPTGSNSSEAAVAAAEEVSGPTILGVDSELQKEMRGLIAQFIEQQQMPGDAAENLTKAFDSAMLTLRRPADEFGIEPDAAGNIEWPEELEEEMVKPLRAEFDEKKLFDTHKIDLPVWARPLLDEYNADKISPMRKELLFRLASGDVIKDMT